MFGKYFVTLQSQKTKNMKEPAEKEFGKWLMDIAKYVVTAILISSFLGSFGETWMVYAFGVITASLFLTAGLLYLNKKR